MAAKLNFFELVVGILLRRGVASSQNAREDKARTGQFRKIDDLPLPLRGCINHG